ncbi:MAG: hypothetical protein IKX35_05930 [Bacteroidales bacterium]|nr:hypothetical protein [Bacteroidales bacterium]MBR5081961.1 hypothetical protein [Bacteroidales bacterium]
MEVEDFYTGEKKEIVIPEGCIMIDEDKLSYGHYALIDDDEDVEGQNAEIIVDFFPNNPKRFSEIPLYKSSKEGLFSVIVIKDKYYKWVDIKKRQKQNEVKQQQNTSKQQAVFDKKSQLRLEGDLYRKDSKTQQAIDSYNMALQVEYKTVNKWFKLYCIDEDLQSLDGLIAIYHKQNDFEKERDCIERAVSLASLNTRHEKHLSKYQHRLGKLLGTYKEKEIPPESHMNVVYTDLINDCDVYRRIFQPYVIKNGRKVYDKLGKKRERIRDYLNKLMRQGQAADNEFDYKTAADIYERLIAEGYDGLYVNSMYDRLIAMYFKYKFFEDEVRIINLAIEAIRPYHNKRLEQLEKRLVSAQKRLQSLKKEGK